MPKGLRIPRSAVVALGLLVSSACSGADSPVVAGDGTDPGGATSTTRFFWDDDTVIDTDSATIRQEVVRDGETTTLFVGDSVLVSISDDLAARIDGDLVFDAVNCRQLGQAVSGGCGVTGGPITSGLDAIADALERMDEPPDVAVLVLANNSEITAAELDEAMDLLGDTPRVWWVNARIDGFGRQDLNNDELIALERRDDRVGIIDWFDASDDDDLFRDHVHPNEAGQRVLARLVRDHLACDCVP